VKCLSGDFKFSQDPISNILLARSCSATWEI